MAAFAISLLMLRLLRSSDAEFAVPPRDPRPQPALDDMTRDQLYELARERGVPGRSKMNKSQLRAALEMP